MFAWLLLYVYVSIDVLNFVVLFQNGVQKRIFFVPPWMLLHVYVLVHVLRLRYRVVPE